MNTLSPEALVIAATSSAAAQQMAMMAAILSGVTLIICLVIGAICIFTVIKFDALVKHTNSIMDQLVKTTRSEATAQGNLAGRAALTKEQEESEK